MRSASLWAMLLFALMVPTAVLGQAPTPAAQAPQYRINAGDELEVYVWGEERLQRGVKVLPDGTIAFPLVGQIVAQGMLPRELEQAISERLRGQYRGEVPQVTVSIVAASGMQFSVMGRVNAPGAFTPASASRSQRPRSRPARWTAKCCSSPARPTFRRKPSR